MGKYLISTVETYRVESEAEATQLIATAKASGQYKLSKYASEKKEVKAKSGPEKGEVIEEYWKVALTKVFNDIKEPEDEIAVKYSLEGAFGNESSEN